MNIIFSVKCENFEAVILKHDNNLSYQFWSISDDKKTIEKKSVSDVYFWDTVSTFKGEIEL